MCHRHRSCCGQSKLQPAELTKHFSRPGRRTCHTISIVCTLSLHSSSISFACALCFRGSLPLLHGVSNVGGNLAAILALFCHQQGLQGLAEMP